MQTRISRSRKALVAFGLAAALAVSLAGCGGGSSSGGGHEVGTVGVTGPPNPGATSGPVNLGTPAPTTSTTAPPAPVNP